LQLLQLLRGGRADRQCQHEQDRKPHVPDHGCVSCVRAHRSM
jgi:hypothetical protein